MREACDLILKGLDGLMQAVRTRAEEHRRTPMIGRTHGVHAEPMTFGLKLALWYAELDARRRAHPTRARGRSRSASCRARSARSRICRRRSRRTSAAALGLEPAPVASQVIQRDRHAELLSALAITGSSLEKFALEIRGLAEDRDRRGRGTVRQRAEGLVGDAAQAQPDRLRADRRAGAAAARQRRRGVREQRALARARHLAFVGRARHPAGQLHRARSHAAPLHADRQRAWSSIPSACARTSSARAASCSPAPCCSSSRGAVCRASRRTNGCSATRCARSTSSATSKTLLLADADVTRVLTPCRHRARVRSRRAAAARRRHLDHVFGSESSGFRR